MPMLSVSMIEGAEQDRQDRTKRTPVAPWSLLLTTQNGVVT